MTKTAPKPTELNIDLLPKEDSSKAPGTPLHWILNVGRYLIIATEIVALGTFIFGIILSKEKNDLRNTITADQSQVSNLQTCDPNNQAAFCEERFLRVQNQLNQIASLRDGQSKDAPVLAEFVKLLPTGLTLNTFSLDKSQMTFSGKFANENQLQTLITSFNNSTKISNLDITDLTKENGGFTFSASATVIAGGSALTQGGTP